MKIVKKKIVDRRDPYGYRGRNFAFPSNAVNPSIPLDPWKRANLGNEVRALHILNNAAVIPPSTTGYINKGLICKLIDDLLDLQRPKRGQAARAKRRLFHHSKVSRRKSTVPKKRLTHTELFKYNVKYSPIRSRKIKRGYLDLGRNTVLEQIKLETIRKHNLAPMFGQNSVIYQPNNFQYSNGKIQIITAKTVVSISPEKISDILKFHQKMARPQITKERSLIEQLKRDLNTDACRLSRRVSKFTTLVMQEQYTELSNVQQQMIEESMRSSFMMTLLMNLVTRSN